jgi:hypothetical protein
MATTESADAATAKTARTPPPIRLSGAETCFLNNLAI